MKARTRCLPGGVEIETDTQTDIQLDRRQKYVETKEQQQGFFFQVYSQEVGGDFYLSYCLLPSHLLYLSHLTSPSLTHFSCHSKFTSPLPSSFPLSSLLSTPLSSPILPSLAFPPLPSFFPSFPHHTPPFSALQTTNCSRQEGNWASILN